MDNGVVSGEEVKGTGHMVVMGSPIKRVVFYFPYGFPCPISRFGVLFFSGV